MGDFVAARQHLVLAAQIKLSHWQQLPYILFGLGHRDPAVQRRCASRALAIFDSSEREGLVGGRMHHFVTLALCAPGTAARRDMDAFVAGNISVRDSPILLMWAGKFMFTPVAERWVESLHAAAKRGTRAAPHAGPVHMAFQSVFARFLGRK